MGQRAGEGQRGDTRQRTAMLISEVQGSALIGPARDIAHDEVLGDETRSPRCRRGMMRVSSIEYRGRRQRTDVDVEWVAGVLHVWM